MAQLTPLQAAINDAYRHGFAQLAIRPDSKVPAVASWEQWQQRRPTPAELRQMFGNGERNLALICGTISGGLAVLDIDRPALADAMAADVALQAETTMVRTPRDGLHVYCIETEAASRSGPLVPGVADLKAGGGYVLAPPSSINGREYKTLADNAPKRVPNAREWAIEVLQAFDVQLPAETEHERLDVAGALQGVPEGQRDETLFKLACKLRRADVPQEWAERMVCEAAARCSPPFRESEAVAKVRGAYGRYEPAGDGGERAAAPARKNTQWPADAAPEAFYGLAGDIVRTMEPHTEADPHALLTNILVAFGNAAGPGHHFVVGQEHHGLRLNAILVGETGHGRKGQSWAEIRGLLERVEPDWAGQRITSGLSSGEGLIWAVRDPQSRQEPVKQGGRVVDYEMVVVDAGVSDKRLLVVEPEFARTLKVMGRDGNILSAVVRQAWDSGNLRVLTRNSPIQATGAHISAIGHITREELLRHLDTTEAANGFGNRLMWVAVKRSNVLPEGGSVPDHDLNRLVEGMRNALDFAKQTREMRRDAQARDLWADRYPDLSAGRPGLYGALTGRAEAQVMRLACVYALLDATETVKVPHLLAALAFWSRAEATVRYIFGDATGDVVADAIMQALRAQGSLTQTDIYSGLFGRHHSADRIARALSILQDTGLVASESQETQGRPVTVWRSRDDAAQKAQEAH